MNDGFRQACETAGPQMKTIRAPFGRAAAETARDRGVVVVCAIGLTISLIYLYALRLFIVPLSRELEWSRRQTSAGLTLISLVAVIGLGPTAARAPHMNCRSRHILFQ